MSGETQNWAFGPLGLWAFGPLGPKRAQNSQKNVKIGENENNKIFKNPVGTFQKQLFLYKTNKTFFLETVEHPVFFVAKMPRGGEFFGEKNENL